MSDQCRGCQHLQVDDLLPGQHCYMFAVEPWGCRQHTGRSFKPLVNNVQHLKQSMPLLMQADEIGELDPLLERLRLRLEGKDYQAINLSLAAETIFERLCEIADQG